MTPEIRVRFAPSPTGALHIGGARTALYNWLYARHNHGTFVLRIEDTDQDRSSNYSFYEILQSLKWLGIDWDEGPEVGGTYGPYFQSQRLEIYQSYIQKLLKEGKAYYCFCSPEELQEQKNYAQKNKINYRYNRKCLNLSANEVKSLLDKGFKPTVRLKVSANFDIIVKDLVRGEVPFKTSLLDDFIICKSDGWPTYNFAVVIDDYLMKISHVIRAEEHLSNTPKQLLVYNALGWKPPEYAHISMILAPDRSKLSKRHGATSVQEFKNDGYLPSALINYLALLGWSTGDDTELMNIDQMIAKFDLTKMVPSPAIYDLEKLTWMNGQYIKSCDLEVLVQMLSPKAKKLGWFDKYSLDYFSAVVDLVRTRSKTLNDLISEINYFFEDSFIYEEKGVIKFFKTPQSINRLSHSLRLIKSIETLNFNKENLEKVFRQEAEKLQIKVAELIHPTRLALSGKTATPGFFEIMELLGQKECIKRIENAINYINTLLNN